MKRLDVLKEIFTAETTCDFCGKEDRIIIRAFLHPIFQWDEKGAAVLTGVAVAKKCMICIEEDSE